MDFFLRLIATKEGVDTSILLHSLRLVGNSCADTGKSCTLLCIWQIANHVADENREIIVKDNYTLAIIQHFLNPDLIHVAIPVVYNICTDFGEPSLTPESVQFSNSLQSPLNPRRLLIE